MGGYDRCKACGGGRRCSVEGCRKAAQGGQDRCTACGGGQRCTGPACASFTDKPHGRYRANGEHLCWGCFVGLHPELAKLKVRKEQYVLAEFQRLVPSLSGQSVTWDCPVPGGCSLKRPDLLYDLGEYYLQLEVDEDGHEGYDCFQEDTRLEIVAADLGKPGYVFRIDPDAEPCFKRRRLSNGETALAATPAFARLMAEVALTWMEVEGVVPDGIVVRRFTGQAGASSSSSSAGSSGSTVLPGAVA